MSFDARYRFSLAVLCSLIIAMSGCGKSEQQKRDDQAAEDARWEANVAAAEAERLKEEQRLTDKEVSRLSASKTDKTAAPARAAPTTNPAIRPSGWAVASAGVTKQNMDDAEAAVLESLRVRDLEPYKQQQLMGWDRFLPGGRSATPVFRDVHWNISQTAICGEVDFEWAPPGENKRRRSGFQKFVLGDTTHRTIAWGKKGSDVTGFFVGIDVDRRYPWFGQHYDEIMAVTDCTPDLDH